MKKYIFSICFLFSCLSSFGQAVDTTTAEKKARYWASYYLGKVLFQIPTGTITKSLNRITDVAVHRVPYLTAAEVRSNKADTARIVHVLQGNSSSAFFYDPADVSSLDDGAIVLVTTTGRRYIRPVGDYVDPMWWGAKGDSTTDDSSPLQKAIAYASAKKKTLWLDRQKGYKNTAQQIVMCDVAGYGRIYNTSAGEFRISKDSLTIRDIFIYGRAAGSASIKANASGYGIRIAYVKDVTVQNVKIECTSGPGLYAISANNTKIDGARIKKTYGTYGDAIYFGTCLNPSVTNCIATEFERIGATFEQNSENAYGEGNTFFGALTNTGGQINAGMWAENCRGAKFINNNIYNTIGRGIVVNGIVSNGQRYTYILSNNTVKNAAYGLVGNGGSNQILNISGGSIIDCPLGLETNEFDYTYINGVTFAIDQVDESTMNNNMLLVPTRTVGKKSVYVITNCINARTLTGNNRSIRFGTGSVYQCDLYMRDCVGNWSIQHQPNQVAGKGFFENVTLDYSPMTSTSSMALMNFSQGSTFERCNIILNKSLVFTLQYPYSMNKCVMSSDSVTRLEVGNFGSLTHDIQNSTISNIEIYNIRRANTSVILRGNTITGYGSSGFLNTVVVALANLELINNKFSSTVSGATTAVPIQLGLANTTSMIGPNQGPTDMVTNVPNPKTIIPVVIYNSATTAPTKSGLNTSYGNLKNGSIVVYKSITGGSREYRKETDDNASNWREYIWSTGVSANLP